MTGPERRVRIAAIYDQYRKFGLKTDKQINDFFELSKTDQRVSDIRNQLAYNAENTVIRFRGVDPNTAFVFRNMAFVAGWLRAATRYGIKYPLDHPVLANVGFNLGQQGWEKARDIISEVPRELEGAITLPDKYKKDIFVNEYFKLIYYVTKFNNLKKSPDFKVKSDGSKTETVYQFLATCQKALSVTDTMLSLYPDLADENNKFATEQKAAIQKNIDYYSKAGTK
jgi:hypothetical protein